MDSTAAGTPNPAGTLATAGGPDATGGPNPTGTPVEAGGPNPAGRLPDFCVIGTAKSGTTTLYRWLDAQPEVRLPTLKEPNFFGREDRWALGLDWYRSLFAGIPEDLRTGEASVRYTAPELAELAAARIAAVLGPRPLICLLRDPAERARSHYRHQVQRGRERRPFPVAVAEPHNPYIAGSCYATVLRPYVRRFGERLAVVRFEDLLAGPGWEQVCTHLGLTPRPAPAGAHNVTAAKARFSGPARLAYRRRWHRLGGALGPLRRPLRRLLLRDDRRYRDLLASAAAPLPADAVALLAAELDALGALLGRPVRWDGWDAGP